jgi:membrane-bound lytic murein transglycosylase D
MVRKSIATLTLIYLFSTNSFSNVLWENQYSPTIPEDTSMVVPPDYEKAVVDMMNDWYLSRSVIEKCYRNSTDPVFYPDSVYIHRLQMLPYRIEMPYNNIVGMFINRYAKQIRQVEYMVGLGEHYYFSIFEQALAKYDLPLELKYLPIIESALNSRAVSYMGAGGLWQFIVGTGKIYDLEINSLIDERSDPVKSSEAAARYLRDLYAIYNDWHLVIAAYNCGPGNVARAIRKSGGKTGYWTIYPYLPKETRGYVPIFIAANYIMNYYQFHNICPAIPTFVQTTDSITVDKRVHLQQISEVLNIPIEELRFLNPQYKRDIIPGNIKPYVLVLPAEQISLFSHNLDSILAHKANELIVKQITAEPAEKTEITPKSKSSGKVTYYQVRHGDTLSDIARKYGTTVAKIKGLNGLSSNVIRVGQRLKVR